MRVLLDECVSHRLRFWLEGHDCQSVVYAGLAGLQNGTLLHAAEEAGFDVLLTLDRGIEYQQNLSSRRIAILVLAVKVDTMPELKRFMPRTLLALATIKPGQVVVVTP